MINILLQIRLFIITPNNKIWFFLYNEQDTNVNWIRIYVNVYIYKAQKSDLIQTGGLAYNQLCVSLDLFYTTYNGKLPIKKPKKVVQILSAYGACQQRYGVTLASFSLFLFLIYCPTFPHSDCLISCSTHYHLAIRGQAEFQDPATMTWEVNRQY